MDKQTQDRLWASLTKADRKVFRKTYATNLANSLAYCQERAFVLKWVFGKRNLTSDTEPEEMIHCSRKKVQEEYSKWRGSHVFQSLLHELFGDKCLPDKKLEHRLEQPSVKVEPYTEPETKDNMEEKELNRKTLYDALCGLESASVKVRKALISLR